MSSWFPTLPVIDAENFSRSVENQPIVVIQAWVSWDPASRLLDAWLQQIRDGYTNLHFCAMDIDQEQNWPFAAKWGIMTTPTLVCIFNGIFHELIAWRRPESQMRAKMSDWNSLSNQ